MLTQELSKEEIARHYSACLDSVALIKKLQAEPESEETRDTIARNVEHLKIMLGRDFWTTEDLEPLRAAVK
ncbi:hypothetical protein UFOVP116_16 [uncultured Caudovirales phage]|uniref:Uncharacterized protein n=1 Tax=uncultured Caudovirales phage TaxID=2100421 RepID=A0A6J5L8A0_9CAUD|nr:hypothetical protein UFOVP116_16 [uncultured Caudovirales phage]